jgi:citrate lyase subunit beta/citryl-CoA lyase
MIEKASTSAADAVCIDLEDSVPLDQKAVGRANAIRAFQELNFKNRLRMFRMNAVDTPFAYRDLIEVVEASAEQIDLVMVPKASSSHDVTFVATLLSQIELHRGSKRKIGIEAQIETASGLLYIREIAESSHRLETLIFGPGDFAASMQMPAAGVGTVDEWDKIYPGHRWHAVMQTIVAAARANGLRCMDGPVGDYQDAAGFEKSAQIARAIGFDGKQYIHPSQLATANTVFSTSAEEAAIAQDVMEAYDAAAKQGLGAVSFQGKMIDAANVRIAKVIAEKHRLIHAR